MHKIQNVVILAAGDSTRFWPLKNKNLTFFLGKPLLQYHIDELQRYAQNLFIVVHPSLVKQAKALQNVTQKNIIIQSTKLDGMAGALLSCKGQLSGETLILNGSDIINYSLIIPTMKKWTGLLTAKKMSSYFPGGYLKIHNDRVVQIVEKPAPDKIPSDFVKLVCDYFSDIQVFIQIVEEVKTPNDDWYEQGLNQYIKQTKTGYIEYDDYWLALKYPWHILTMMKYFLGKQKKSFIHPSVKIAKSARIVNPVYINEGTIIGDFALVRESHIGKNCLIGSHSEVARSYIYDNVYLHRNYVGDSVLGQNVLFGAGAVTANFRFDEKTIDSVVEGKKIDSGLQKFGTIIGTHSKVGVNVIILPGLKIGSNKLVFPGTVVKNDFI
jgi:bifunctional UDP-N-acetylglucosamine pyrophosphorylase/glucosamine-1-phosphate N-acetyltransferase